MVIGWPNGEYVINQSESNFKTGPLTSQDFSFIPYPNVPRWVTPFELGNWQVISPTENLFIMSQRGPSSVHICSQPRLLSRIAHCLFSLWPRVQFPATAEYFKGFYPGWSHSVNPSWASVAENGSISPQWHYTTSGQRGGRLMSNRG